MKSKIDELVNDWIEGELGPEDAETLCNLLADDVSAREKVYDLMLLDQLLSEREEAQGVLMPERGRQAPGRRFTVPRRAIAAIAALAAMIVAGLWIARWSDDKDGTRTSAPAIIASSDSRITIAQREDRSKWSPGELLRLERGTAAIQLRKGVLAHFEGPAAVALANAEGDIRLFEGRTSIQVEADGRGFKIELPGGTLRTSGNQFTCQIFPDQAAVVEVNTGELEINSRSGGRPAKVAAGEALRLDLNGAMTPTARPGIPFRGGLPEELVLFRDDFKVPDGTLLANHTPEVGQKWEVLEERMPTVVNQERLDTSAGARRLLARLAPHNPGGSGSVYVVSFSLLPPTWSHDKVNRLDGIESITLVDGSGRELFSVVAEAVNTHRWQLKGGGQASPPTLVCALWEHQLTLCYGLDGRVTLHDGGSAQAPVIANLWLKDSPPAGGVLISNRTGGDLAFRRIEASLLRASSLQAE